MSQPLSNRSPTAECITIPQESSMQEWLNRHWVAAALCMAILLTVLLPILAQRWPPAWLLIFAMLPIYMFHQVEEHTGDRFRVFVNQHVFHGVEALTPLAVLWINLPGVWGVGLLSIYAATFLNIGLGLSMVYLVLVNSVAHIVAAVLWREYNPGLWTALALFVPVGTLALFEVARVPRVAPIHHVVGLAVGIAIHAAIVVDTRGRAAKIARQPII